MSGEDADDRPRQHLSLRHGFRGAGFCCNPRRDFWARRSDRYGRKKVSWPTPVCPETPRAKSVIYLFMCGGVSHIDTFDPKDNKHAGKIMDAIGFGDNNAPMKRPVIPCLRTFTRYGKSGIPVSDWFPHVGERDRRNRGGPLDVLPPDQPFSRGAGARHGQAAAAVRSSVSGQLGLLRAWERPTRICRPSSTSAGRPRPCN